MTTPSWGYQRPDCSGDFAISLFLDDIDQLINHYTALTKQGLANGKQQQNNQSNTEAVVLQAQAAANKLLLAYQNNARKTDAFTHQYIQIKSVVTPDGNLVLLPIFSSGLKQNLIRLLKLTQKTSLH